MNTAMEHSKFLGDTFNSVLMTGMVEPVNIAVEYIKTTPTTRNDLNPMLAAFPPLRQRLASWIPFTTRNPVVEHYSSKGSPAPPSRKSQRYPSTTRHLDFETFDSISRALLIAYLEAMHAFAGAALSIRA
jgi:hypothetical protein